MHASCQASRRVTTPAGARSINSCEPRCPCCCSCGPVLRSSLARAAATESFLFRPFWRRCRSIAVLHGCHGAPSALTRRDRVPPEALSCSGGFRSCKARHRCSPPTATGTITQPGKSWGWLYEQGSVVATHPGPGRELSQRRAARSKWVQRKNERRPLRSVRSNTQPFTSCRWDRNSHLRLGENQTAALA
jgi:hypothetical protein